MLRERGALPAAPGTHTLVLASVSTAFLGLPLLWERRLRPTRQRFGEWYLTETLRTLVAASAERCVSLPVSGQDMNDEDTLCGAAPSTNAFVFLSSFGYHWDPSRACLLSIDSKGITSAFIAAQRYGAPRHLRDDIAAVFDAHFVAVLRHCNDRLAEAAAESDAEERLEVVASLAVALEHIDLAQRWAGCWTRDLLSDSECLRTARRHVAPARLSRVASFVQLFVTHPGLLSITALRLATCLSVCVFANWTEVEQSFVAPEGRALEVVALGPVVVPCTALRDLVQATGTLVLGQAFGIASQVLQHTSLHNLLGSLGQEVACAVVKADFPRAGAEALVEYLHAVEDDTQAVAMLVDDAVESLLQVEAAWPLLRLRQWKFVSAAVAVEATLRSVRQGVLSSSHVKAAYSVSVALSAPEAGTASDASLLLREERCGCDFVEFAPPRDTVGLSLLSAAASAATNKQQSTTPAILTVAACGAWPADSPAAAVRSVRGLLSGQRAARTLHARRLVDPSLAGDFEELYQEVCRRGSRAVEAVDNAIDLAQRRCRLRLTKAQAFHRPVFRALRLCGSDVDAAVSAPDMGHRQTIRSVAGLRQATEFLNEAVSRCGRSVTRAFHQPTGCGTDLPRLHDGASALASYLVPLRLEPPPIGRTPIHPWLLEAGGHSADDESIAFAALHRLRARLTLKCVIDRAGLAAPSAGPLSEGAPCSITFEGVTFAYPSDPGRLVLDDVSFAVPAGAFAGIVGASGSGKSTLLSLLLRLHEPMRGRILVGGVDVRDIPPRWLRRRLGVVGQGAPLLDGTVEANLRVGRLDAGADALGAALGAAAADFVAAKPRGLQTRVGGGRGAGGLSGGEAQRVAVARALMRGASTPASAATCGAAAYVFDEATSALDVETERRVQRAMAATGATTIAVAHRLFTLRDAGVVVVLDHGRVVEQGSFAALAADPTSQLARLVALQAVGAEGLGEREESTGPAPELRSPVFVTAGEAQAAADPAARLAAAVRRVQELGARRDGHGPARDALVRVAASAAALHSSSPPPGGVPPAPHEAPMLAF